MRIMRISCSVEMTFIVQNTISHFSEVGTFQAYDEQLHDTNASTKLEILQRDMINGFVGLMIFFNNAASVSPSTELEISSCFVQLCSYPI